jgi:hypothetical protein
VVGAGQSSWFPTLAAEEYRNDGARYSIKQIREALINSALYQGTTLVVPQVPQNQRGL